MYDQAKYEPLEASRFFADGTSARPLPAHTVARGFLRTDPGYWTGVGADGRAVDALPMPLTPELLTRGRKVYETFCSPCHGLAGAGDGMIVQRGFKQPPSFHDPRLRAAALGYFVDVVSRGLGQMPAYASQVPVADRWAVAAYLRALQRSQSVPYAELSADERARLESSDAPAPAAGSPHHE
jgi:mono/diheme cytochrome c family protein